jgi:hypothetical protein
MMPTTDLTSVTRLAGTADAVTTTYAYEPAFNQLTSLTDPLNHTTSFGRLALVGELLDHLQHLPDELGIERRGDLVEQQQLALHDQCPGDRHPLLLSARELARVLRRLLGQPHSLQHGERASLRVGPADSANCHRPDRDVLQDCEMREEVQALEDHADAGPDASKPLRQGCDVFRRLLACADEPLAEHFDLALLKRLQVVDAPEQRALAGSAGADNDQYLAPLDFQLHRPERLEVSEPLTQLLETEGRPHVSLIG